MAGLFLCWPHRRETAFVSTSLKTPVSLLVHLMYRGLYSESCSSWSRNCHKYGVEPFERRWCLTGPAVEPSFVGRRPMNTHTTSFHQLCFCCSSRLAFSVLHRGGRPHINLAANCPMLTLTTIWPNSTIYQLTIRLLLQFSEQDTHLKIEKGTLNNPILFSASLSSLQFQILAAVAVELSTCPTFVSELRPKRGHL